MSCCSVENLEAAPGDHEVVRRDAQDELARVGGRAARGERGAESALVAAEGTLRMPALTRPVSVPPIATT